MKEKREKRVTWRLTPELDRELDLYCSSHKIKSKSDLIRVAIRNYIEPDVKDETLRLIGIKDMQIKLQKVIDAQQLIFNFLVSMHKNTLAYFPEIPATLKQEASMSASKRFDIFYEYFQNSLKDDIPFFERILHQYYSGDE
jgi:Arc/MetJ-type ribon-helix-helix transcriptional regulator